MESYVHLKVEDGGRRRQSEGNGSMDEVRVIISEKESTSHFCL